MHPHINKTTAATAGTIRMTFSPSDYLRVTYTE